MAGQVKRCNYLIYLRLRGNITLPLRAIEKVQEESKMWEWTFAGFYWGLKFCCALLGFFVAAFWVFWSGVILFLAFSEAASWLKRAITGRAR